MKREIEDRFRVLGGIVPIGGTFTPVSGEELLSIEAEIGEPLPEDYREFLKSYGSASFGELVEFQLGIGKAPLSHFYGSQSGKQGVAKYIKVYRNRMPDSMIPIADDGGGNQICLGVKGNERGRIYYWDHHNEWDAEEYSVGHGEPKPEEAKFQNVGLVAESFQDLIQRLYPVKLQ